MDLELTIKGRRLIEEDCGDAFQEIDIRRMEILAGNISPSKPKRLTLKLLRNLQIYCPYICPYKDKREIQKKEIVDLQALLFYEAIEKNRGYTVSSMSISDPSSPLHNSANRLKNLGDHCFKLLESYLLSLGLIKESCCELL